MSTLIACLSTGKGTWGHVSRLIKENEWSNIFLITNEFGKENFTKSENTELILINQAQGIKELAAEAPVLKEPGRAECRRPSVTW